MEKSIQDKNNPKISHYLGVDFGKAKIGLATADSEVRMAFPYGTLNNDKDIMKNLITIIEQEEIDRVIIGLPSYINRKEVVYDSEKFGEQLQKLVDIPIEYHNEMFSTLIAKENLRARGVKNVHELDHEESARIILQSWLDQA